MQYTATLFLIACYIGFHTFFSGDLAFTEWSTQPKETTNPPKNEVQREVVSEPRKGAYVCSQSLPGSASLDTTIQSKPVLRKTKVLHFDESLVTKPEPEKTQVSTPSSSNSTKNTSSGEAEKSPFLKFLQKLQQVFQYSTGLVTTVS
jgi:hypothetical protein